MMRGGGGGRDATCFIVLRSVPSYFILNYIGDRGGLVSEVGVGPRIWSVLGVARHLGNGHKMSHFNNSFIQFNNRISSIQRAVSDGNITKMWKEREIWPKLSVGQMSPHAHIGQMFVGQVSVDQMSVGQVSVGQMGVGQMSRIRC